MVTPSAAVIDALNSLLEAEVNSIFNFVGTGSPYLDQASPAVRGNLEEMRRHLDQHEKELSDQIHHLGGIASTPAKPDAEEQYLAFLSLRFLLPKLVDAKELMIERYRNVLRNVQSDAKTGQILQRHIEEMLADLAILKNAAMESAAHR